MWGCAVPPCPQAPSAQPPHHARLLTLLWSQVEGFTAYANVAGQRVLSTFGIDASRMTTWIIVLCCLYPALLLLACALLYWRLPRPQRLHRSGDGWLQRWRRQQSRGSRGCSAV